MTEDLVTVLLIEDDLHSMDLLHRVFHNHDNYNFLLLSAYTVDKALEFLQKNGKEIDLVFASLPLLRSEKNILLKKIIGSKNLKRKFEDIKLIVWSDNVEDCEEISQLVGHKSFLIHKPVSIKVLSDIVTRKIQGFTHNQRVTSLRQIGPKGGSDFIKLDVQSSVPSGNEGSCYVSYPSYVRSLKSVCGPIQARCSRLCDFCRSTGKGRINYSAGDIEFFVRVTFETLQITTLTTVALTDHGEIGDNYQETLKAMIALDQSDLPINGFVITTIRSCAIKKLTRDVKNLSVPVRINISATYLAGSERKIGMRGSDDLGKLIEACVNYKNSTGNEIGIHHIIMPDADIAEFELFARFYFVEKNKSLVGKAFAEITLSALVPGGRSGLEEPSRKLIEQHTKILKKLKIPFRVLFASSLKYRDQGRTSIGG